MCGCLWGFRGGFLFIRDVDVCPARHSDNLFVAAGVENVNSRLRPAWMYLVSGGAAKRLLVGQLQWVVMLYTPTSIRVRVPSSSFGNVKSFLN